ncbi:hypothetical protein MCEMHM7_00902 [Candidatus Methylopumilus planktonicus]
MNRALFKENNLEYAGIDIPEELIINECYFPW